MTDEQQHERTEEFSARVLAEMTDTPRTATLIYEDAKGGSEPRGRQQRWGRELEALRVEGRVLAARKNPKPTSPWLYTRKPEEAPEPSAPAAGNGGPERRTILHAEAVGKERNWIEARLEVADAYDAHAAAVGRKDGPATADAQHRLELASEEAALRLDAAKEAVWKLWRWQRHALST